VVDPVKAGVTVGMAKRSCDLPGHAVKRLHDQWHAHAWQRLRGWNPLFAEAVGGDRRRAVYPPSMVGDLETNVGDFWIDCSRMPTAEDLKGKEPEAIDHWLQQVSQVRAQQAKLFDYLLSHHKTDFSMFVQSCEDRVGHWLYPIQPYNAGYDPALHNVRVDAFPDQYRAFDQMLGKILQYVDGNTYLFIIFRPRNQAAAEFEEGRRVYHSAHDHGGNAPIIAKHDFEDGDDVPGIFIAIGPNIKRDVRLMGFTVSVFDIAPTILSLYGSPSRLR